MSRSVPSERFQMSLSASPPRFSVSLRNPNKFSFAAVGDLHILGGDTARLRKILTMSKAEGDEFIVLLGDLIDRGNREDLLAIHQALNDIEWDEKALFILGNHDIFNKGWQYSYELNGPSHFAIDIGSARFIALDTADGGVDKDEMDWFKSEIKKSRPKHLFLLSHYMPTVPGQRTYLRIANESQATELMKLASVNNARAWLGAHYHSYLNSTIDGVTYVVAGGGGGRRMPPINEFFYVQVSVEDEAVRYTLRLL